MTDFILIIIALLLFWIGYNTNQIGKTMVDIATMKATVDGKAQAVRIEIADMLRNKQ